MTVCRATIWEPKSQTSGVFVWGYVSRNFRAVWEPEARRFLLCHGSMVTQSSGIICKFLPCKDLYLMNTAVRLVHVSWFHVFQKMLYFLHFFFPNALSEYQDRLLTHHCQTRNGADCNTGPAGIHRIIRSFATCTRRARRSRLPPVTETGLHWWLMLGKFSTTMTAMTGTSMVREGQMDSDLWFGLVQYGVRHTF